MPILARKIGLAKWESKVGVADYEIPADAVTVDLRTSGNALSFWKCRGTSKEDLHSVVLALACSADRLDKIDVAWIQRVKIEQAGLVVQETEGHTPVPSLVRQHVDVPRLDFYRLGKVAKLLNAAVTEERYYRFRKKEILALIANAAQRGLLALGELSEKVREEVKKKVVD